MSGYAQFDRQLAQALLPQHGKKFTETEAYVFLASFAAFAPREQGVGGKLISLNVGELVASLENPPYYLTPWWIPSAPDSKNVAISRNKTKTKNFPLSGRPMPSDGNTLPTETSGGGSGSSRVSSPAWTKPPEPPAATTPRALQTSANKPNPHSPCP